MVQGHGMTLKQLRFFCRVVDAGTITEAASTLNVAQTAVGVQIRCLEDLLAAPLLERRARGVVPTEIGLMVYERARQIVDEADTLSTEIRGLGDARQRTVTVGMVPSMMRAIGARAVTGEAGACGDAELRLVEGARDELIDKLKSGRIGYAYVHDVGGEQALRSVPVLRQSLVLLTGANEKAAADPLPFREAIAMPLVLRPGRSWIRDLVFEAAASLGCVPNLAHEIESESAILEIVSSGAAAAIVVGDAFSEYVALGTVVAHPIVQPSIDITLYLAASAKTAPGPADRKVLAHLDRLIDGFCALHGCSDRRLGSRRARPTAPGSRKSSLSR